MAKLKMQKLRIAALSRDRKRVLERLQRLGLVEPVQVEEDEILRRLDTSRQQSQFEDAVKNIDSTLDIINEYVPEKSGLLSGYKPRADMTEREFRGVLERSEETMTVCRDVIARNKEIGELTADNIRSQTRLDQLELWLGLDVPLNFRGTASTAALIGTLPMALDDNSLLTLIAQNCAEVDAVDCEVVGTQGELSCVVVICLKKDLPALESTLRGLGFAQLSEQGKKTPAEISEQIKQQMNERSRMVDEHKQRIASAAASRREMQYLRDSYEMRRDKYRVIEQLGSGSSVFVLEGWATEHSYDKIEREMEKLDAFCERIEAPPGEDAPVALKNNGFTEGGVPVLEMYALPSRNDIDPTPVMAFFYYLLFGIMLGDAAYGLIMVLATGFVMLKFRPEEAQRRTMKLFFYSGISSIIWGVLFGSYFGDLPNSIAYTFFGATHDVVKPIWFDPIGDPMMMMYVSIGLGAVHVLFGLLMGVAASMKNKDTAAAIFDYLAWFTLIVSVIAWALLSLVSLPFEVPAILPKVFVGIILVSVAAILLMNGRGSKNFIVRILKGAYALYGITGYLSDLMSYSRILALGLATGVISKVFNQMATMVGGSGSIPGIIAMVIVLLIGHAFNIGISLIGCYVHTCRLQYVEFFGKFYEGGGKAFEPLSADSKHFKFKEEN